MTNKLKKESIIEIEGINVKDLSWKSINFYFKCSKEQRDILREYLEQTKLSQKQEDDERFEKMIDEMLLRYKGDSVIEMTLIELRDKLNGENKK